MFNSLCDVDFTGFGSHHSTPAFSQALGNTETSSRVFCLRVNSWIPPPLIQPSPLLHFAHISHCFSLSSTHTFIASLLQYLNSFPLLPPLPSLKHTLAGLRRSPQILQMLNHTQIRIQEPLHTIPSARLLLTLQPRVRNVGRYAFFEAYVCKVVHRCKNP